jgi:hypothetical protein
MGLSKDYFNVGSWKANNGWWRRLKARGRTATNGKLSKRGTGDKKSASFDDRRYLKVTSSFGKELQEVRVSLPSRWW